MGHHDLFFKKVFSIRESTVDFVRHMLPIEMRESIDYSSIRFEKESHVDSDLSEYFSDTVYSCRFQDADIKIALLFEHKSSPKGDLTFQLFRYMTNLWKNSERQNKPRLPVIPIVVYHGKEHWNPGPLSSRFKNLPLSVKPFVPDFEYIFVNLADWSNDFIRESLFLSVPLKIGMLIMKNIYDQEVLERHLTEFLEPGCLFFEKQEGLAFLQAVITYLLNVSDIPTDKMVTSISNITEKGGKLAMTTAEKLRQEGRKEGRLEGGYTVIHALVHNAGKRGFSDEDIAQLVDLDLVTVRKILNNEKVEIPLHLLNNE